MISLLLLKILSGLAIAGDEPSVREPVNPRNAASMAIEVLPRLNPPASTNCSPLPGATRCSLQELQRYPEGSHGQLFFGRGPFYISHLPMWAEPHNFQAIYEVDFPETPEGSALRDRYLAQAGNGYATFNPSSLFKMPEFDCRVQRGQTQLDGTLFSGHFERGGQTLGELKLVVKRRIYFRELSLDQAVPDHDADPRTPGDYLVFGPPEARFASRLIRRRPAVDHIFPVRVQSGTLSTPAPGDGGRCYRGVRIGGSLRFGEISCEGRASLGGSAGAPVRVEFQEFYQEAAELR